MVQALLDTKGGLWLTQARVAQYQAKLLENPKVTLQACPSLNPATLLPETEGQEHDCLEVIDAQYSSHQDLEDQPLLNADYEWYTDGSSTVVNGLRRAGYAVVSLHETVEAKSLPPGTSAQLAEIVALTLALELSKGKRVNIFTDCKYAFGVLHAHAGLWKQRGLLMAQGSPVKHRYIKDSQPLPLDAPIHSLQPGDFVLVWTWKDEPLQEKWKEPYLVLLVSHTAAKVEGHKSWIHYSRLKAVPLPQNPDPEQWTVQPTGTGASEDLGLKLLFKCK
ncbi:uncharacterized protein LOC115644987 [Gopherus evgoodei]|uniref:uncharacterized protein LOC115644987 n=1 Tax=Gopherus evgoodei TaxID=1825980 RepID=UPI0011CFBFB9|nr:uncharacterized protein LOC115644987 [Gopherus evgoodei]